MTDTPEFIELSQQQLWDMQHAQRGAEQGLEGDVLVNSPNNLAVILGGMLEPSSSIIEVGSANGRDARFWAKKYGHNVLALDFSQVALDQLSQLAKQQGLEELIVTGLFDANEDPLPSEPDTQDAFYARSALHVVDDRLTYLLHAIHGALREGGLIAIEGKHPDDPKIMRSIAHDLSEPHLLMDPFENGHARRSWDPEATRGFLDSAGFVICELEVVTDETIPGDPAVFTRVVAKKQ